MSYVNGYFHPVLYIVISAISRVDFDWDPSGFHHGVHYIHQTYTAAYNAIPPVKSDIICASNVSVNKVLEGPTNNKLFTECLAAGIPSDQL